ncbi:MAG: thioester domain-containing protein [Propionibacteriaceae bacterium]|jgi:hypothetical protein|nr:thioester domain-containing protein [Propionibacteriaceae bacterium]
MLNRNRTRARGAVVLTIAMVAGLFAVSWQNTAAKAAPAEPTYSTRTHYDDDIQMFYSVLYDYSPDWAGYGDIQLGGLWEGTTQIVNQKYCIDAQVHYHSEATHPQGQPYVDVVNNYVAANPQQMSANVQLNYDQLIWLAINGYDGTDASVTRLAARYGLSLNHVQAVMATKVAVWEFTNPSQVAIVGTSITGNRDEYVDMIRLMRHMIDDANAYATGVKAGQVSYLDYTRMALEIDNSTAAILPPDGGYFYYGPLSVVDNSGNPTIAQQINTDPDDRIYLGIGGVDADAIDFVTAPGSGGTPLPADTRYGTDQTSQYLDRFGQQFYLRIPVSSRCNLDAAIGINGLVLHALAKASGIELANTPMFFIQQTSSGLQDWDLVQAFVGLATNVHASLYGQADLVLNDAPLQLSISKEEIPAPDETEIAKHFTFQITTEDGSQVALVPGINFFLNGSGSIIGDGSDGQFQLMSGATATVNHLATCHGSYRVSELNATGYTTSYTIDSGASEDGTSALIATGSAAHSVTFTNTHPEGPWVETGGRQDSRGWLALLAMLPLVAGAMLLQRSRRETSDEQS